MGGKVTVLRVCAQDGMLWIWTPFSEVLTSYIECKANSTAPMALPSHPLYRHLETREV